MYKAINGYTKEKIKEALSNYKPCYTGVYFYNGPCCPLGYFFDEKTFPMSDNAFRIRVLLHNWPSLWKLIPLDIYGCQALQRTYDNSQLSKTDLFSWIDNNVRE